VSCALRAAGPAFDVDAFLRDTTLPVDAVHRRGQPRLPGIPGRHVASQSGFNSCASEADFDDLGTQIRDAIQFLTRHETELRRLRAFPGVEAVTLDFGIRWREVAVQKDTFPSELLCLAGALGMELTVSHYPIADDDEQAS
jgi:hypothetical protein